MTDEEKCHWAAREARVFLVRLRRELELGRCDTMQEGFLRLGVKPRVERILGLWSIGQVARHALKCPKGPLSREEYDLHCLDLIATERERTEGVHLSQILLEPWEQWGRTDLALTVATAIIPQFWQRKPDLASRGDAMSTLAATVDVDIMRGKIK